MDNIILALEGSPLNMDIVRFGCYIAELTSSELTAAFITDSVLQAESMTERLQSLPYDEKREYSRLEEDLPERNDVDENMELFKEACRKRGIRNDVVYQTSKELIYASRFTDLIIADPRFTRELQIPSVQTKTLLSLAECPVLLAPESYTEITEVIHCYDGSQTSVLAIKLFSYLFPTLLDLRCILLQVNKDLEWSIEGQEEMQRWLKPHYSQAAFNVVQGDVEEGLYNYLKNRKGALVTMGAYGRNSVSIMLKESRANGLIRSLNLPIFISH